MPEYKLLHASEAEVIKGGGGSRIKSELLTTFQVLDFDAACADAYRQIVEAAGYSRRKVADRMIAATALAHGLVLVTANAGDFEDVPGLTLDIW